MKGILVIRKYKNRRLYDTERSSHITLKDLLDTIRSGRVVQVQEASTGEDVTVETLLQLLLSEDVGVVNTAVSSEFAHFLVSTSPTDLGRFFREFVPLAAQAFQASLHGVQDQQRRFVEALAGWGRYATPWMAPLTPQLESKPLPAGPSSPGKPDEVDELKARLQELESRFEKLHKRR